MPFSISAQKQTKGYSYTPADRQTDRQTDR